MSPDDPRHGTSAGYVAGCRNECCRLPRMRQQKATRFRVHRGEPTYRQAEEVSQVIAPWLHMGLSHSAILEAAGLKNDHALRQNRVLASTYDRLAAVTEDSLPARASIWSDLTKRRIFSLMAAGHRLVDMPINSRGAWRDRDRTLVSIARSVRDYYAAREFQLGPSTQTATRARGTGHKPPMSWDDPGTLTWPLNMTKMEKPSKMLISKDVDPVVVERFLAGDTYLHTTKAEKVEIVRRWPGSLYQLEQLGWKPERYIVREKDIAS